MLWTGPEVALQRGETDAYAVGRFFTSNADLPEGLRNGYRLTPLFPRRVLGGAERWYADFTAYGPETANAPA